MDRYMAKVRAIILSFFMKAFECERRRLVRLGKIKAAAAYVHVVRAARLGVMGLVGLVVCSMVLFLGLFLIHVALFIYLPWTITIKLLVMAILGLIYIAAAVAIMVALLSEKRWMRHSGATRAVEEAAGDK